MSQSGPAAIEVVNLSHAFGSRWAVRNASFEVPQGALHGFVGPNGAGKTTTLKSICTLLIPHSGTIRVLGLDVVAQTNEVRRRLGFMPDHFSMYRRMTVFEYLDFFAAAYGIPMTQRDKVIDEVLTLTDMEGRREELVGGLSRGMQQQATTTSSPSAAASSMLPAAATRLLHGRGRARWPSSAVPRRGTQQQQAVAHLGQPHSRLHASQW